MWKYILKRIILALITTFIILSITFILIKLLPYRKPVGTNETMYAYYMKDVADGYVYDFRVAQSGLGDPLWTYVDGSNKSHYFYEVPVMTQYGNWLKNIITEWNWGQSSDIAVGMNATAIIIPKLAVSMQINIIATIIAVPIGIAFGILAALKKNKPTDHVISTLVMVFISIPSFVLITFVMAIFCYGLGWLPTKWPDQTAAASIKVAAFVVPVLCLSFGSICGYTRFTRAELCEVMSSEYLLLARTKGLTKRQSIMRHALRNAMVPIVPSILAEFLSIMGGSMILENLYGIPGIGSLFVDALNKQDYNVLFVEMAIFTTFGLCAGVLVDISYGFIDPRIRMGAKK